MSFIGARVLPAVALAVHRHHDRPARPITAADLARRLELFGEREVAAFVAGLSMDGVRELLRHAVRRRFD